MLGSSLPDFPRFTELRAVARDWNGRPQLSLGSHSCGGRLELYLDHSHRVSCGRDRPAAVARAEQPDHFLLTTILGIVGAFVATFLGQTIGWYRADQGAGLIGATVGAIIVLFIWNRLVASRTISDPGVTGRRWL